MDQRDPRRTTSQVQGRELTRMSDTRIGECLSRQRDCAIDRWRDEGFEFRACD